MDIKFIPVTYFSDEKPFCICLNTEKNGSNMIQKYINDCFFEFNVNTLVANYNNQMYILEPDTTTEVGYTRTEIKYHPLAYLFDQ